MSLDFLLVFFLNLQSLAFLYGNTCSLNTRTSFHVKHGLKDRSLQDGRKLKVTLVENDPQCFSQCSKDCRCLSFNVCGKTCQLNGANRFLVKQSLRVKPGCRYYDYPASESTCQGTSSDLRGICCARMRPPCFNGGYCEVNITDTTRRFQCKCPRGFYGDQCQVKKPKMCLDYWVGPMKPISREYTVEDQTGNLYEVFCDYDSEKGIAWTLIESFAMNNEPQVLPYPFTLDHPLNENDLNWNIFRLSKNKMQHIGSRSVFWRATCSYPIHGIDFRDYVRVRLSVQDPTMFVGGLTYNSDACIQVDYLNIKGKECVNCTTTIFQTANEMLHIGPWWGRVHYGCSYDSSNIEYYCSGNSERARMFGVYWRCADPSYRCSKNPSSTTQFWFGGSKS